MLLSYCLLALQPDLRLAVPELIGVTALIASLLTLALFFGERRCIRWSPALILTVAAAARLLFLYRAPELSDDIYRYLWDGLTLLSGKNPYAVAPALLQPPAETLAGLQQLVNHAELVTIYPPAAQLVFAAGALCGGSIVGLKLLLILLDLASCLLIMRLLAAFRQPAWLAVLYAWQPLAVLEVGASGHIDSAGIFFFLASLCLMIGRTSPATQNAPVSVSQQLVARRKDFPRLGLAGGAFSCAVLVKLLPLIFLPGVLLVLRRQSLPFLLGAFFTGAALLLPFLPDLTNALGTLQTYALHWEFAGFSFRSLRQASGSGESARMILAALFLVVAGYRYTCLAVNRQRFALQESNSALLAALQACSEVTFCFLLLTPTLHPWYALYLAAFLPFASGAAQLVLCWSVFLGYQVLLPYTILGQWQEDGLTAALVTLAPITAFLAVTLLRRLELRPE
ncbi:MAG: hypothetical protein EG822_07550 [Deltaproteobacteria bacterium]|nr:hypothetical protein [Deltaproteobacteria bacterium]TLN04631.1 MAG: hypothetical protein FDZ73_02570 [bacterium]